MHVHPSQASHRARLTRRDRELGILRRDLSPTVSDYKIKSLSPPLNLFVVRTNSSIIAATIGPLIPMNRIFIRAACTQRVTVCGRRWKCRCNKVTLTYFAMCALPVISRLVIRIGESRNRRELIFIFIGRARTGFHSFVLRRAFEYAISIPHGRMFLSRRLLLC